MANGSQYRAPLDMFLGPGGPLCFTATSWGGGRGSEGKGAGGGERNRSGFQVQGDVGTGTVSVAPYHGPHYLFTKGLAWESAGKVKLQLCWWGGPLPTQKTMAGFPGPAP